MLCYITLCYAMLCYIILYYIILYNSLASSVSSLTKLPAGRPENWDSTTGGSRHFHAAAYRPTSSGVHTKSCPLGTGANSTKSKWPGHKSEYLFPCSAKVNSAQSYTNVGLYIRHGSFWPAGTHTPYSVHYISSSSSTQPLSALSRI